MKISIRADDVLQKTCLTKDQNKRGKEKTFFEWFLEADKMFAEYDYPCTLAILAEGLDQKEWVDYIKKNKHRYNIELHGYYHGGYNKLSKDDLLKNLICSQHLIEKEFDVEVTTWYVPFGRKRRNPYDEEVCKMLGLELGIPKQKIDPRRWLYLYENTGKIPFEKINFHFWREDEIKRVNKILEICNTK